MNGLFSVDITFEGPEHVAESDLQHSMQEWYKTRVTKLDYLRRGLPLFKC